MTSPAQRLSCTILLSIAGSASASTVAFEHWMGPPPGEAVIDQCDWEWREWNQGPTDVIQYFTAPTSQFVSGAGFIILTPIETPQLTVSIYDVNDIGMIGQRPLTLTTLSIDYFQSFGVEEFPVWGYATFDNRPHLDSGELYALRLESPLAFLQQSDSDPLVGGYLEGSPQSDLSFRIFMAPEPSAPVFIACTLLWGATRRTRSANKSLVGSAGDAASSLRSGRFDPALPQL